MNKKIMKSMFPEEMENIENGDCPLCEKPIKMSDFKNEISKREYEISKICQKCQDAIY